MLVIREELRRAVSKRYSGPAHLVFTLTVSLGVTAALLSRVHAVRIGELAGVPLSFLLCGLLEYLEHRFLLHRRSRLSEVPFRIHTLEHHRFFTDEQYRPESRRDFAFILFPPQLVVGYMLLVVPLFAAPFYFAASPNMGYLVGATAAIFFFLYEVVHFASHLGEEFPLRSSLLHRLGDHHRLHHRAELMTSHNFNVVFPLFDWIFGTLKRPSADRPATRNAPGSPPVPPA